MTRPIGVQLYTVNKEIEADRAGTLRKLAEIGYDGVEMAPTDWPDAREMKILLEETGLRLIGRHVSYERLRDNFIEVSDFCHALDISDLVIPSIPKSAYEDEAKLRQAISEIDQIARKCTEAGFRCSYHNHLTEFTHTIAGREVYDVIFETVSPQYLKAQIDTFFIQELERNPADYIRKFAGRVPLLHLKDKSKHPDRQQAEVGQGTIDWNDVLAAANEAGVQWLIVEQNCSDCDALESARISYEFLKSAVAV